MSLPILICDDSNLARKQMARALPSDWDIDVSFATNGKEALEEIKDGKAELLFLDLNMPVLDGFGVLEEIQKQDLPSMVIVVSADVQESTRAEILKLGALDLIAKPTDQSKVNEILNKYGILTEVSEKQTTSEIDVDIFDCYREVTNVAMGRAANLLGKLLNARVILPVPKVNLLHIGELHSALQFTDQNEHYSAICQGFIGAGIAGEALLIVDEGSLTEIKKVSGREEESTESLEIEFIMDIANVLIGAYLQGIGEQIDITFNQGHPTLLGQHRPVKDLLTSKNKWDKTLAIEIVYKLKNLDFQCELLLLFAQDTLPILNKKINCLLN